MPSRRADAAERPGVAARDAELARDGEAARVPEAARADEPERGAEAADARDPETARADAFVVPAEREGTTREADPRDAVVVPALDLALCCDCAAAMVCLRFVV